VHAAILDSRREELEELEDQDLRAALQTLPAVDVEEVRPPRPARRTPRSACAVCCRPMLLRLCSRASVPGLTLSRGRRFLGEQQILISAHNFRYIAKGLLAD